MCGRYAQFSSRDEYLQALGINGETIAYDPQPLARYNVAPGSRVLILSEREGGFVLDPVLWGYSPEWWTKSPLINAAAKPPPAVKCSASSGITGVPLCLRMAGMSGKKPAPVSSPTSSTARIPGYYSWPHWVMPLLTLTTAGKDLSFSRPPVTKACSTFTIAGLSCSMQTLRWNGFMPARQSGMQNILLPVPPCLRQHSAGILWQRVLVIRITRGAHSFHL